MTYTTAHTINLYHNQDNSIVPASLFARRGQKHGILSSEMLMKNFFTQASAASSPKFCFCYTSGSGILGFSILPLLLRKESIATATINSFKIGLQKAWWNILSRTTRGKEGSSSFHAIFHLHRLYFYQER